jgi:hypothetical protein
MGVSYRESAKFKTFSLNHAPQSVSTAWSEFPSQFGARNDKKPPSANPAAFATFQPIRPQSALTEKDKSPEAVAAD